LIFFAQFHNNVNSNNIERINNDDQCYILMKITPTQLDLYFYNTLRYYWLYLYRTRNDFRDYRKEMDITEYTA